MYSLAAMVGILYGYIILGANWLKLGVENVRRDALKSIKSGLSTSNVVQELFSSFAAKWV